MKNVYFKCFALCCKCLFCILWLFFLLDVQSSHAQQVSDKLDSLKAKRKNSFLVVPLVFSTPETDWAFGLAGAYIFKTNKLDTNLRTSTMPFGFTYTIRNQFIAALGGNIFTSKEKYIIRYENSFSKFPDYFWGIGNGTMNRDAFAEFYTFSQYFINPQLHRKVYKNIFIGISLDFQKVFDMKKNIPYKSHPGGLADSYFNTDKVLGSDGYFIAGRASYSPTTTEHMHTYPKKVGFLE